MRKKKTEAQKAKERFGRELSPDELAVVTETQVETIEPEEKHEPWPRFQVSLHNHGPTSIHEATDSDGAWEAYKKQHGIIKVDPGIVPEILQLGQDGKPLKESMPEDDEDLPVEGEPITAEEEAKWAEERKADAVGVFKGPVGKP